MKLKLSVWCSRHSSVPPSSVDTGKLFFAVRGVPSSLSLLCLVLTSHRADLALAEVNPRYVLRNWMAQSAIGKAEMDDFSEVKADVHKYRNRITESSSS